MKVYIGTSGWSYNHWRKIFYPDNLSKYKFFEFYCKHFNTVEINATFYRNFKESTYKNWYRKAPEGFLFSLKAPKIITHIKRLKDIEFELKNFLNIASILKEKLGVILFQLPPSLKFDKELFEHFFELLKKLSFRFTIEVRNKTFQEETFIKLLKDYNIPLCFSDTGGRYFSLIEELSGDFLYIRLHGPEKLYASCYTHEQLLNWKNKILKYNKDSFIYFDNDFHGFAPQNGLYFKSLFIKI